jgi:aspartyl-tRNA(Asn)/glutamyl-tRNA(Gln) amidotransferase subunit A
MLAATNQVTRDAFRETVGRLVELGAAVETIDIPALSVTNAAATAVSVEVLHVHRDRWDRDPDRYGSDVAARLRKAESIGIDTTVDVLAWDAGVRHALARLFSRFDVLITPTVGSTHKVIGQDDMDIDGEGVFHRLVIAQNTWPVNRAGNPALALPIASKGTPPASLQLIGPRWAEADLLEIGLGLEQAGIAGTDQPPTFV